MEYYCFVCTLFIFMRCEWMNSFVGARTVDGQAVVSITYIALWPKVQIPNTISFLVLTMRIIDKAGQYIAESLGYFTWKCSKGQKVGREGRKVWAGSSTFATCFLGAVWLFFHPEAHWFFMINEERYGQPCCRHGRYHTWPNETCHSSFRVIVAGPRTSHSGP